MNIQALINEKYRNGGGTIIIPKGNHVSGTIILKDNITLHLEKGANIIGSEKIEDYPLPENYFIDAMGEERGRALIYADQAENIAITGEGVINGRGALYPDEHPQHAKRPFLVRLLNCKHVRIFGVELREAAAWTCHLQGCEDVNIEKIKINSKVNHNNDGIDIDSCKNVKISHCDIYTGDDAICVKATLAKACDNVEVSHCKLYSDCATLKLGTESYGDMTNIYLHDCKITHAGLGALKVLTSDGAIIENIRVENIEVDSATGPIMVRLGDRGNIYDRTLGRRQAGKISNVEIVNFTAKAVLPLQGTLHHWTKEVIAPRAMSGICMTGLPNAKIDSVKLRNVNIQFVGTGTIEDAKNQPTEQPEAYPELHHFGVLPASCFYLRHINSITMDNVKVSLQNPDARQPLVSVDVDSLKTRSCEFPN